MYVRIIFKHSIAFSFSCCSTIVQNQLFSVTSGVYDHVQITAVLSLIVRMLTFQFVDLL